jgi:lysylphosphatidylglycerol synthetase-like protein (DUF2156 family)
MGIKNTNKVDDITFVKAIKLMFKDIKSGRTLYLAFTKRGFCALIFVMAMSVIANLVLVDLLISAPTLVQRAETLIFVAQLILSISAVIVGLWLFLKGVNIVTEK